MPMHHSYLAGFRRGLRPDDTKGKLFLNLPKAGPNFQGVIMGRASLFIGFQVVKYR